MNAPHLDRMARAEREAGARGLDALVISPSPDLAYLTGYDPMPLERPTLLLLRPGREPVMLVPALEAAPAAASPVGGHLELVPWNDGSDPYEAAGRLLAGAARVAVADRLWSSHLLGLQRALPETGFTAAGAIMGRLRAVKDGHELEAMRRAGRAADESFRQILELSFQGRSEVDVAQDLADLLVRNGHARAEFTIVASGPNAASPHHEPGGRTILPRDAVVMDFGGELGGYFSDTTRTVVVVEPPDGFEPAYDVVRDAQAAAVDAVRPGIETQDLDRIARSAIEGAGYGERFIHRTGHGIGLEVHEPPYLVEGDRTVLEPGMTFSVEPGVYLDGRFGIRIEDIVVVTEDGVERLNRSARDLRVVA
ncbi:MAG TPA: Xaa-Pro peptidase family protein [Actinomycetota bacterium]|nr:Xaa-Pro peptidase family protein [Actinomycetota bacterium]